MPTVIKTCRNCGKQYEACHTARRITTGFRWQDVACSPECGEAYLKAIRISRGIIPPEDTKDTNVEANMGQALVAEPVANESVSNEEASAPAVSSQRRSRKKQNVQQDTSEE